MVNTELRRLEHFIGTDAMNVEFLPRRVLRALNRIGVIRSCVDLYKLDKLVDFAIQNMTISKSDWHHIWSCIQKSREVSFRRFLFSVDIPLIDKAACTALAKAFHSNIAEFMGAVSRGSLEKLPAVSTAQHNSICRWFADEENFCNWYELLDFVTVSSGNLVDDHW